MCGCDGPEWVHELVTGGVIADSTVREPGLDRGSGKMGPTGECCQQGIRRHMHAATVMGMVHAERSNRCVRMRPR